MTSTPRIIYVVRRGSDRGELARFSTYAQAEAYVRDYMGQLNASESSLLIEQEEDPTTIAA